MIKLTRKLRTSWKISLRQSRRADTGKKLKKLKRKWKTLTRSRRRLKRKKKTMKRNTMKRNTSGKLPISEHGNKKDVKFYVHVYSFFF